MIVYHVTTLNKIKRYSQHNLIMPPVRAWESIEQAERFSKSTARRVILRLKFPKDTPRLAGHKGKAFVLNVPYPFVGY